MSERAALTRAADRPAMKEACGPQSINQSINALHAWSASSSHAPRMAGMPAQNDSALVASLAGLSATIGFFSFSAAPHTSRLLPFWFHCNFLRGGAGAAAATQPPGNTLQQARAISLAHTPQAAGMPARLPACLPTYQPPQLDLIHVAPQSQPKLLDLSVFARCAPAFFLPILQHPLTRVCLLHFLPTPLLLLCCVC